VLSLLLAPDAGQRIDVNTPDNADHQPDDIDLSSFEQAGFLDTDDDDDIGPARVRPLAATIDDPIPALRDVRAQLVTLGDEAEPLSSPDKNGETVVLLEDPEGLAPKSAALSAWAYAMATLFNGERNAKEVVTAFSEKYGQAIDPEQAIELQKELDKAMFLHSRRFEKALKKHVKGYLDKQIRPAAHAGTAYPLEPDALRETIAGFFTTPDGPGSLDKLPAEKVSQRDTTRAIILPHIDLRVGGETYAHGYQDLICNSQAEIFVVLGVAHQSMSDSLFYVSQKDYATPLGVIRTNRPLARRLQAAADADEAMAELAHRTEHSVEFQALLLGSILEQRLKRDIEIVPVLCDSVEPFLQESESPLESPKVKRFAEALRNELDATKKKWCIICSVDLSHVGPEFGHSTMITERLLPPIRRADLKLLKIAESLDASAFYNEILRTQNSRHVDAVMSVLTMLKATEGLLKHGRLLHYDQMLKKGTHSAVSYASMAFDA
jgi:MEMO1 family protein